MAIKADGLSGDLGINSARAEAAPVRPGTAPRQAPPAATRRFEQAYQQHGGKRRLDQTRDPLAAGVLGAGEHGAAAVLAGQVTAEPTTAPKTNAGLVVTAEPRITLPSQQPSPGSVGQAGSEPLSARVTAHDGKAPSPVAVPTATKPSIEPKIDIAAAGREISANLGEDGLAALARRVIVRREPQSRDAAAPGDAILHGWQRLGGDTVTSTSPANQVGRLAGAVEMWLARTQGAVPAVQQARFEVVLPQGDVAKIQVFRDGDGLQIRLAGSGDQVNTWLHDHSQALQQRLQQRTGLDVAVRVDTHAGQDNQQDGRSRQQRDLYEELNDDGARFNRPLPQIQTKRGAP